MAKEDKRLYTAQKSFTFRGMEFKVGAPFDPVKAQCDVKKLRTLISSRYLAEGYNEEDSVVQVGRVKPTPVPVQESPAEAESDAESEDQNVTDGDDNEVVQQTVRRSRRKS